MPETLPETLPPCPRADCDAYPEDAPHHFHNWWGDSLPHRERIGTCITGGPGLSSRCYSAHVNLSESPTGSTGGDFRDKLAGAAIPIMQRVKTVMLGEDLMPLARDIVDRMLPLSVSMADALTGELDELRLHVGVIDRRRDELAAERDELRARLDAVLALHYAADNDLMRVRLCAMCHGKAGVHECGCWADEDDQPVCGHCLGERNASVPYPCPTRRAAEGDES